MNKLQFRHIAYGLLLFLITINLGFAQDEIKRDSSAIDVRYFEDNIKERYNGDDFNYSINDTGGVNLIQRVLRKFFGFLNEIFGIDIDFLDYKTLEYIIYTLMAIGALYLLINFLLQNPMDKVFTPEDVEIEGFNFVEEDITEINFDNLIEEAVKKGNYRLATRYLYLKSLKALANKNIIEWHYDKTNSDYLGEITNKETRQLFKRVSYIYDYVWYGEFAIDQKMFERNRTDFSRLANG